MYRIEFTTSASRQLKKFDKVTQARLVRQISELASQPRPPGVKKLESKEDLYRIRVGDYRVIYTINDSELLVLVVRIGHRSDVYE
ncbi:type II toxin-antitoxin system RelE family toxin [Larkinella sp. VNQ87]|uniref:type II toxin-antitoxin system RelE family toxin n=1 Tax=Larkinella sp. VNQ87 TaxID=3400921 RepID=UPI003C0EE853